MKLVLRVLLLIVIVLFLVYPKQHTTEFTLCEGEKTSTEGLVIKSVIKGPTVYVIAGIHGNEPAGIEALKRLQDIKLKKGTLVILAKANQLAVTDEVRTLPSLGDLNRAFPGREKGMAVEELAYEIHESIRFYKPEIVLDLHESKNYKSGDVYAIGHSIIYIHFSLIEMVEELLLFLNDEEDEPYVYFYDEKEGTLNTTLSQEDIPIITFETDVEKSFEDRVSDQLKVIYYILDAYELIKDIPSFE